MGYRRVKGLGGLVGLVATGSILGKKLFATSHFFTYICGLNRGGVCATREKRVNNN